MISAPVSARIKLERNLLQLQSNVTIDDSLSPEEVNALFRLAPTAYFNLLIWKGTQSILLNPNLTLLQALPQVLVDKEYLYSVAFCLRAGADPNMYVNAPQLGPTPIHLLAYSWSILGGSSADIHTYRDAVLLMLLISGSRSIDPVFDRRQRIINPRPNSFERSRDVEPGVTTVGQWINSHGEGFNGKGFNGKGFNGKPLAFEQIQAGSVAEFRTITDDASLLNLSIVLNQPGLRPREYTVAEIHLSIKAFADQSLTVMPLSTSGFGTNLEESITYLNLDAFTRFLRDGQRMNYNLTNILLLTLRAAAIAKELIAVNILEDMLIASIEQGLTLDTEQLAIINNNAQGLTVDVGRILSVYSQPVWRKLCKESNVRISRDAARLGLDPTVAPEILCRQLETLDQADRTTIIVANMARQQARLTADTLTVINYLGNNNPNPPSCLNASLLSRDPLAFTDLNVAAYSAKTEPSNPGVWCFIADQFDTLIETGINPYDDSTLPVTFTIQIRAQNQALKALGLRTDGPYIPETFAEALTAILSPDRPRDSSTTFRSFLTLGTNYRVQPTVLQTASLDQLRAAALLAGLNPRLEGLSPSHARLTIAVLVLNASVGQQQIFFGNIISR